MAKDLSKTDWHGIPRTEIPWFPTIKADACIGCGLCFVSCGREVFGFEQDTRKATVDRPFNCMVGCSTCATICPTEAITFPGKDLIRKVEKEFKILSVVRKKKEEKLKKQELIQRRAEVEQELTAKTTQMRFQVSGEFGEKRFLVQLWELLKGKPYDIVNLKLEVPTVQGARQKTPSFMQFDVTSTELEDIQDFLKSLRDLIHKNGFVLVAEQKI